MSRRNLLEENLKGIRNFYSRNRRFQIFQSDSVAGNYPLKIRNSSAFKNNPAKDIMGVCVAYKRKHDSLIERKERATPEAEPTK